MSRDLAASREAILAAAEGVFADAGYAGASLQQIATAAGVSRGMPGYVFGSKAALYEAVLRRAFASPRAMAADLLASLDAGGDLRPELEGAVGAYIDFLAGNPAYVRLLQRASLDGAGPPGGASAQGEALADAVRLTTGLAGTPTGTGDPRHLLVSLLALCFFPFAHGETLLAPLGLDPHDPAFLAERKAHVVDLLLGRLPGSGR